jgi:hypothetical protein
MADTIYKSGNRGRGRPRGSKNIVGSTRANKLDTNQESGDMVFRWSPTKLIVLKKAISDCGFDPDQILRYLRELGWQIEKDTLMRRIYRDDIKDWFKSEVEKVALSAFCDIN